MAGGHKSPNSISDISSASSDSGDSCNLFSLASSDDADTSPESPVSFGSDMLVIDPALLIGTDDVACRSFETCGDGLMVGEEASAFLEEQNCMQMDDEVQALGDGEQERTDFGD